MNNIFLFHTVILTNYNVHIFYMENDLIPENVINNVNNIIDELNIMEYPSNIVEKLEPILSCKKLDIYDKNNNLLLSSSRYDPFSV